MSFKPDFRIGDVLFDDARSVGMTEDLTSDTQVISEDSLIAIQAIFSGTPVGILKLQNSLDNEHWCDAPSTETEVSGPSSVIWDISHTAIPFWQIVYTYTSSTGILNVKILVK